MAGLAMERDGPLLDRATCDAEAFAAVFERHHAAILRYLAWLVGDLDSAEDLAQDTFVKAYRALTRGAPPESPSAWLYTIATNTALSALRRRRLIAWLPLGPAVEADARSGPDLATLVGERALLARALGQLKPRDAAILLLHFQQGLSYPELAEVFRISVPAARMCLSRARAAFREAYLRLSEEGER